MLLLSTRCRMVIDPPTALSWRVREHINYGLTRFRYVSLRPLLPRSRHLSVALIDGGSTQNVNNTGVRLWTDCQQVTSLTSFCKHVPTTRCRRQVLPVASSFAQLSVALRDLPIICLNPSVPRSDSRLGSWAARVASFGFLAIASCSRSRASFTRPARAAESTRNCNRTRQMDRGQRPPRRARSHE